MKKYGYNGCAHKHASALTNAPSNTLACSPMHRSLHTPCTHVHILVSTCIEGPDLGGGDLPPHSSWPSAGLEPKGDSTQALCPLGQGSPRGFTEHLQGHNPLLGCVPDLTLPGALDNGAFSQQRQCPAWLTCFLGVGGLGLAPLVFLPSGCGLGQPKAQQTRGAPSPAHSAGRTSLPPYLRSL